MLVIYRKSDGRIMNGVNTNTAFPDGPPFEHEVDQIIRFAGGTREDYGEYRLHDTDDAANIEALKQAGSYELAFDEAGTPTGVTIHERLAVTTDKAQIAADGVDTATVTATLPEGAEDGEIAFEVNAEQVAVTTTVNRVATLEFASAEAGAYMVEAVSARHGRAGVGVRAG